MATPRSSADEGLISRNPGIVSAIFAVVVAAGFLFALYSSATGHHGGGGHGPAPHGSPAAHPPAAPAGH